ncbi:MAG: hypothetical protein WBA89_28235 [Microcoleus sp.]|uniref:hypothetical protein n=1 Tax=Microcoleus sp. TaxID=44472 RepID=UPI003C7575B1
MSISVSLDLSLFAGAVNCGSQVRDESATRAGILRDEGSLDDLIAKGNSLELLAIELNLLNLSEVRCDELN